MWAARTGVAPYDLFRPRIVFNLYLDGGGAGSGKAHFLDMDWKQHGHPHPPPFQSHSQRQVDANDSHVSCSMFHTFQLVRRGHTTRRLCRQAYSDLLRQATRRSSNTSFTMSERSCRRPTLDSTRLDAGDHLRDLTRSRRFEDTS